MDFWWKKPEIVKQLADWSYDLVAAHPNDRLLSLGQSPAWVVRGAGMIRRLRGEAASIGLVPFTGTFLRRTEDDENGMSFTDRHASRPDEERIARYFNNLSKIGAHPLQIAADHKQTVLVEMIREGNGLAAFLDLWTGALDGQKNPLKFYIFDTAPQKNSDVLNVQGNNQQYILNRYALDFEQSELMLSITPHNTATTTSSRLTPIYKLNARSNDDGMVLIPNKPVVREITAVLHAEIQKREQEVQRLHWKQPPAGPIPAHNSSVA